jgi:hypothetical protein
VKRPPEIPPPGSGNDDDDDPPKNNNDNNYADFGPLDLNPAIKGAGGPADVPQLELTDQVSDMLNGFSIDYSEDDVELSSFSGFDAIAGGDDDGFRDALAAGTINTDEEDGFDDILNGVGINGIEGGEAEPVGGDDEVDAMMGGFGGADPVLGGDYEDSFGSAEPAEPPPVEDDDG